MSYDPNLKPKGSWTETCADKPGLGMHVVISTKFGGGYLEVSKRVKTALQALGCTVYNPNTDNKKASGHDGWLLSFTEGLDSAGTTNGFVYQLQQGKARMKSEMQQAEEKMGKKWGVPKIGAYIPDDGEYGDTDLRGEAWAAIQCARRQWAQRVLPEVELVEEFIPEFFGINSFRDIELRTFRT